MDSQALILVWNFEIVYIFLDILQKFSGDTYFKREKQCVVLSICGLEGSLLDAVKNYWNVT